jgi:hypothetical protein
LLLVRFARSIVDGEVDSFGFKLVSSFLYMLKV